MRPKEWLVKNGHLPAGSENARGRISRENVALLTAAVASGVSIEGYSRNGASVLEPAKVERVAVSTTSYASDVEETVPEKYNRAFVGTREIGMRTVCNTCRRSLAYHICDAPKVWLDSNLEGKVEFKSRPNPETFRNRWW